MYSALFNPDDTENVDRIEADIAQVREEGGLDAVEDAADEIDG